MGKIIIGAILFGGIGAALSSAGVHLDDWQFWAVLFLAAAFAFNLVTA